MCAAERCQRKFPESSQRSSSAEADGTNPGDVTDSCPVEIPPSSKSHRAEQADRAKRSSQSCCSSGEVALIQKNYCEPVDYAGRAGLKISLLLRLEQATQSLQQPQHSGSSDQTSGQNFHYAELCFSSAA